MIFMRFDGNVGHKYTSWIPNFIDFDSYTKWQNAKQLTVHDQNYFTGKFPLLKISSHLFILVCYVTQL